MYKAVLCLIIILSSGFLGLYKASLLSQRVKELQELREILMMLHTEISYMKDPLPVIFRRLGEGRCTLPAQILHNCSVLMNESKDMQYCWSASVELFAKTSCLTSEDIDVIYNLGLQLGRSSVQGQLDLLAMTGTKLKMQLKDADENKRTKGKMYAGMGFFIGIIIAVIFI